MSRLIALSLIALTAAACAAPPANLDVSPKKPTEQRRFVVALQPPATAPAINKMHSWTINVATPDGEPVRQARIAIDGGMPQHGHGLPTRPRVTRELGDGSYLMEGMKFSMTGWWEIKLAIDAAEGADKVTFNTVVQAPTAR
jgi:hypothetical protein